MNIHRYKMQAKHLAKLFIRFITSDFVYVLLIIIIKKRIQIYLFLAKFILIEFFHIDNKNKQYCHYKYFSCYSKHLSCYDSTI